MSDDIDELLKECEAVVGSSSSTSSAKNNINIYENNRNINENNINIRHNNENSEYVEDLLSHLINDDEYNNTNIFNKNINDNIYKDDYIKILNTPRMRISNKRCDTPLIGGTRCSRGYSDPIQPVACDNLRCTSCDFQVIQLASWKWKPEVEYLFFRNYYPDVDKLKSMMEVAVDEVAYCCQCSWRTICAFDSIDNVNKEQQGLWKCFGH
eukprot:GHVR01152315.1.p1 GENE.GHVR01152315.1~~GHVR01152315.1.p1  ORF type:complete len:210 (+),score=48.03 GHVR01152315.1:37-666(+)